MTRMIQRIDKWLWYARLVKTRSLASRLILAGKVRINRVRIAKPSQGVKRGDVITATIHRHVRVLKVLETGHRRGPAEEAKTLYEDMTEARAGHRTDALKSLPAILRARGTGRPSKRDRRRIDAIRQQTFYGGD